MTTLAVYLERAAENRRQTLRFLDYLKRLARAEARERGTTPEEEGARLLAADPAGGRLGHIAWHLLHIAAYEEGAFGDPPRPELWSRYGHGSRPELPVPSLAEIEARLAAAHACFHQRAAGLRDDLLDTVPPRPAEPGMTYREVIESIVWHEPHHLNDCSENLRLQYAEG